MWRRIRRAGLALGLGAVLHGCLLPTPVSIGTTVLDVVLLVTTGKSSTDHLISAIMMQDCVLFRLLEGEEICISRLEEVPMQVPEDLYLRVSRPDGSTSIEKVTRIQPVHAYSDMIDTRPKGQPMEELPQSLPNGGSGGIVDPRVTDLPSL